MLDSDIAPEPNSEVYFTIVLHAHLPFVRRPDFPAFLEENWFFEAISETYLPLIRVLSRMGKKGKRLRFALSLSPTLITMLADELLKQRYRDYLTRQLDLCRSELRRVKGDEKLEAVVRQYHDAYRECKRQFTALHCDLLAQFRHFADLGMVELLTSSATHAFLPLYRDQPVLIRLQLMQGVETFQRYLCRKPAGLWLPECGYYEGLEEHIHYCGYEYFIVSANALEREGQVPVRGVFAPVDCGNGCHAFICDKVATGLIWDPKAGYPGAEVYRDFHRDIGFELPLDYLLPFLPCADRATTGMKYWAVGKMGLKPLYQAAEAEKQVSADVEHFYSTIRQRGLVAAGLLDRPPLICCAYDAELFGHWWFEGPLFLERLFDRLCEQNSVRALTPSEYSALYPRNQRLTLAFSSWGDGGFAQSWLDSSNSWIYRHIYGTAFALQSTVVRYKENTSMQQTRLLNQAVRELLLAMASDWPMIIASGTMSGYAERCLRQHLKNCQLICNALASRDYRSCDFFKIEAADNIFADLNYLDLVKEIEKNASCGEFV